MSRVRVLHTTTYRYSEPVRFQPHRLVMRPREGHDVHVEHQELRFTPNANLRWHRDIFGNSVVTAEFADASDILEIVNDVIVSRTQPGPSTSLKDCGGIAYPVSYSPLEAELIEGYRAPVFPAEAKDLRDWAGTALPHLESMDAAEILFNLMRWIYQSIRYRRREDRGVQSPAETLAIRSGSCRDMATLLLEGVRSLGFAARFASGYLDSPASAAGRAATHAWTEVYLPDHGWFGCDPTLGENTSSKHIVMGVSSHPRGVMPVSGAYSGSAEVYLGMMVSVHIEPLEALPSLLASG